MHNKKIMCPNIVPCGGLHLIFCNEEEQLFIDTYLCRSDQLFLNQFYVIPRIPYLYLLYLYHTVSRKILQDISFFSKELIT